MMRTLRITEHGRLWATGLFAAAVALTSSGAIAAQEATPPASGSTVSCDVAPQPIAAIVEITFGAASTPAAMASPAPVASEAELPQGDPVDAETAAVVDKVVQTWIVCLGNSQDGAVFALSSDTFDVELARGFYIPLFLTEDQLAAALEQESATPVAGPMTAASLAGRDLRHLADDRIGGIWSVDGDSAFVILTTENGQWVVDEIIDITEP